MGRHSAVKAPRGAPDDRLPIAGQPQATPDFSRIRSMAIMQGDLGDYALPELLQFLLTVRKKGQLLIECQEPPRSASVYFAGGRVVHAYCPPDVGEQAIYRLLHWRQGRFMFLSGASPELETIHTDLRNLLLEGMRIADEQPDASDQLPHGNAILHAERDAQHISAIRITVFQWRLLSLIDGRRTIADIIALCGRDASDASVDLLQLLHVGLVSEHPDERYLSAIVAVAAVKDAPAAPSPQPLPILSSRILQLADGKRSILAIRDSLQCSDNDLIQEVRFLVGCGRLAIRSGQAEYDRYVC